MHPYTKYQNTALFILRLIIAAIFIAAAYAKFPLWSFTPEGMSPIMLNLMKFLSIVEPLGALALIFGFLTRWAAGGLAVIMVGAIYFLQFVGGIGFTAAAAPGWNFPLAILAGCIILNAFGPGRWSIDFQRGSRRFLLTFPEMAKNNRLC
jgi:putative oxidoreductase